LLLVLDEGDAAFNWIKPIPKPPTAPASNPSSTSTGTFSRSLFLLDMLASPLRFVAYINLAFALPIFTSSGERKALWQLGMAQPDLRGKPKTVKNFSTKAKRSPRRALEVGSS
jgi:hypothetical protein